MSEYLPNVSTNGNARTSKIRTFLSKPPKGAVLLVMTAAASEGTPLQLAQWERDEIVPGLAPEIEAKLDEHASEMGGSVLCTLTYLDKDGRALATMPLKRQANHVVDEGSLAAAALQGDAQSVVITATAQSLQVQRMYLSSMQGILAAHERLNGMMEDRGLALAKQVAKLEIENQALREALAAAEAFVAANQQGVEPQSEGQEKAWKLLEAIAPHLMQRLLAPAGGAPAPQA